VTPAQAPAFVVAVRFHLPAGCTEGCVITSARLALRDGTLLGIRRNLTVTHGGAVRFTVPVGKAALVAAPGLHPKRGWRTTLTHFSVATRTPAGMVSHTRDGHITISLARLKSGLPPVFAELL
ncbi:MAG: hypothetical protein QOD37_1168, partial [Gaiellales bacterium]|nr:hypothetical protein [Gaiellales bacterium]